MESFRFPWEAYPGYAHSRTIGEITSGRDRSGEGKRKGAWRGEEREARCFVLEVKEGNGDWRNVADAGLREKKGKRKGEDGSVSDE